MPTKPLLLLLTSALLLGCGSTQAKKDRDFHTSGSREADQRAEQRIAKVQQIRGEGEDSSSLASSTKKPLYDRLGAKAGIDAILDDFIARVVSDPRINWKRQGISRGGVLGVGSEPIGWEPTQANLTRLKVHMGQFIALATGGPTQYGGKDMKKTHAGMRISNVEFDAAVGDLKASLDALGIATQEQKELLAVIESTRPQIVEER
jgi:hemoglobin